MQSIKEIFKSGKGPSSSHTLAVERACKLFLQYNTECVTYQVELYGSLSLTGRGHGTDAIIRETFAPKPVQVDFYLDWLEDFPNGLLIRGFDGFFHEVASWTVFSLGGGSIEIKELDLDFNREVYPHKSLREIRDFCKQENLKLCDYPFYFEKDLRPYLQDVISQMLKTVAAGLSQTGVVNEKLGIQRIAKSLYMKAKFADSQQQRLYLISYAYAAMEENACGKPCTTAPTLGASGVIAALVYWHYYQQETSRNELVEALALAGLFGNLVKRNATISGAVGGCQAEIGTACAMGSAFLASLEHLPDDIIEYAAEIGMEHHLGLTCDPVGGYVLIPCIERNAAGALRALDSCLLAKSVGDIRKNKVSFDSVVQAMNYTGEKIAVELKETALGGLALEFAKDLKE
ncbi:MAG: L-serine ammonia-lyase, iron-sulfur-dependent, subunit alpha [Erysipelotrichaceae bacterium]|jgi:L-serine dehydratase|nr:L-serine ammonia-lyase, iron-sulfur-dependent, subunit alpha [Erysipelotrichaceae bacterium]